MSYKVVISDGTVLKECIEDIAFNVDSIDFHSMRTDTAKSMIIKGKIDTDEGTANLYKWAMIPGSDSSCYKEVTVELIKDSQLMRKVSFSKAFVVDYSEDYSNHVSAGSFTLYVKQFFGKDIECVGPTDKPSAVVMSAVEKVEEVLEEVKKLTPIVEKVTKKKSVMSITDRIAKQKKIGDNVVTEGNGVDIVEVIISKSKYPESAKHIEDAIANGHPQVLTIKRDGAKANRKASLKGKDKVPGKDLDEYPPAMFKEGGEGASVRAINSSDNRGSGSTAGHKLRPYPDGTKVKYDITDD